MYIKNFSFTDKTSNWVLERIDFEQLSLLVGLSGVGKTRILDTIGYLKDIITMGEPFNGIKWELNFLDDEDNEIIWSGETEHSKTSLDKRQLPYVVYMTLVKPETCLFIEESISINGEIVAKREKNGDIIFQGEKTVKLSKEKSIIFLLKAEDSMAVISKSLSKIVILDPDAWKFTLQLVRDKKYPNTLVAIQESSAVIPHKLFYAYQACPEVFQKIKDDFKEVFDFVEDMKFDQSEELMPFLNGPFLSNAQTLQIKERNMDTWIHGWQISSGMSKTLVLLASLYLSPKKSVILIDEFENSYGLNCLKPVVDYISQKRDLQFIMTSHHPYIISNIDSKRWILIMREANIVRAKKVDDDLSATSQHNKFLQLINLPDFEEGITS